MNGSLNELCVHIGWVHSTPRCDVIDSIFRCYASFREGRPPTATSKISWKDGTSTKTSKVLRSSRQSLHGESGDLPVHGAVGTIPKLCFLKKRAKELCCIRDVTFDIAPEEWTFWKRSFRRSLLMSVPKMYGRMGHPKGYISARNATRATTINDCGRCEIFFLH